MPPKLKTSTIKQRHRLIAAVRTQPLLYEPNKTSAENIKTKDLLWVQVASQCGIKAAQMAKVMWRKMYDSYVAYKKNPKLNETSVYAMFFKHMKFIDPFIIPRKEVSNNSVDVSPEVPEVETIQNLNEVKEKAASNGEFTTFQYWNETEDDTTLQNKTQNETTGTSTPNGDAQSNNETAQMSKEMWRKMYDSYVAYKKNPQQNDTGRYAMLFKHMKSIDPSTVPRKEVSNNSVELTNEVPEIQSIQNLNEIKEEASSNGEFTTFQYWNETEDDTTLQNKTQNETTSIPNGDAQPNNETDVEFNSDTEMGSYEDIILPDNGIADNSLKMFFDAMYASSSQLPLALQRKVKMKVFSTIIEAEEEAEIQKKNSNTN